MDERPGRVHGDVDAEELALLGVERSRLLDLSVNVSPYGPHPEVLRAIRDADVASYPDRRATAARQAIAASLGVDVERVVLGHGAAELLWHLVGRFVGPHRTLFVVGPTFGEPEAAAEVLGAKVARWDASEDDGFEVDPLAIARGIEASSPSLVYLCNPNNPTGRSLPLGEIEALATRFPDVRFVVDQAFLSLSIHHADARHFFPDNVLVVRSLTKDHALAGLRVAYAVASPHDAARLERERAPWMIASPAEDAIVAAMKHEPHVAFVRERLITARVDLVARLAETRLGFVPSDTFFGLVRVGDADGMRIRLLQNHEIAVRSCRSFGLPAYIRVAARDESAHLRLVRAIERELAR